MRHPRIVLFACLLAACDSSTSADKPTEAAKPKATAAVEGVPEPVAVPPSAPADGTPSKQPAADGDDTAPAAGDPTPTIDPASGTIPADASRADPTALPTAEEVAIAPWKSAPYTAVWTEKTAPREPITFAGDLYAGVLGKAGGTWHQVDATGELTAMTMDVEPTPPIMGVWPSDAWMVQTRTRKEEDWEYDEIRLMKLRGGDRWVPQRYGSNEQWFHPGTGVDDYGRGEYDEPHMSTRSGMLMYPDTLQDITRVAGRHDDPMIGAHRGILIDFFETGVGNIYVVTRDEGVVHVQTACEDDACVAANAKRLPLSDWRFGRRVSRGKHSVSVIATSGARELILHHRGKSDGWLLEELPPGEKPTGMWNSEEGGLWTLHGETLRFRDTESAWHDVAVPAGLTKPSVALSEDRTTVWLAGEIGGAPKVFTTPASAPPASGSTP